MAKAATDFTKMFQDMMGAFPAVDTKAFQDSFKSQAALGEKMSKVVLEAAEKSAEISNKWTKSALAKIGEASTVKAIWKPQNTVPVDEDRAQSMMKMTDSLEDDDDVQNVYTNMDIPEDVIARLSA